MAPRPGNFAKDMRAEQKRVVGEATESIRSVAQALYSDLVGDVKQYGIGSPVASGRYASSMRLSINSIDASTAPRDPSYKYPKGKGRRPLPPRTIRNTQTAAKVAARLRTFKLGDTIYISDSVPYVRRIEIAGHSWQAPDGVFGPVVRKVLAQFKNARIRVLQQ